MGRRGPPKKPTALKILDGNPGNRPLPQGEPQPALGAPACPGWLSKEAREEWKRVVPELVRLNLLTLIDRAALAAYCEAYAQWELASKDVLTEGLTVPSLHSVVTNPKVRIADAAAKRMRAFLIEFGLTPASRARISVQPEQKELDEFEAFIKSGQAS